IAPIQRVERLAVMVSAMAAMDCANSLATGAKTKASTKKAKASRVQPRNPASTALCAPDVFATAGFSVNGLPRRRSSGHLFERNLHKSLSASRSLGDRSASRASRQYAVDELAVFDDRNTVDQHERNAFGILQRLVVGGFIDDARPCSRIKAASASAPTRTSPSLILRA